MSGLRLSAIYRYPLKSGRGQSLQRAQLDAFGIRGDRRWMLVDSQGGFISQRQVPSMALLEAEPVGDTLQLRYRGAECEVPVPDTEAPREEVAIWGDRVTALLADAAAGDWLSQHIGVPARLVYLPDSAERRVDEAYARGGERVAFADGFPLLLISAASLADLNTRLADPVPMNRFRPNLVVEGSEPFAEDHWRRLRIGGSPVTLVKPCSRCVIPSIDQASGERDPAINRVLGAYRRRDGAIYFGMNGLGESGASFAVGDAVVVLN